MPGLRNEHKTTRAVIEAIPTTDSEYRPDSHAKSAMELAWHIAAAQQQFLSGIAAGGFDFNPIPQPETVRTPEDIGVWYAEKFENNAAAISAMSGEQLCNVLDFGGLFQKPAVVYL